MGELESLFLEGEDGLMIGAELDGAPPRSAKGYVTCSLAWLARIRPVVHNVNQLLILLLLYRECLVNRCSTVALSNRTLKAFGVSRYAKYRALIQLEEAGAVTIENQIGRAPRVTLLVFP